MKKFTALFPATSRQRSCAMAADVVHHEVEILAIKPIRFAGLNCCAANLIGLYAFSFPAEPLLRTLCTGRTLRLAECDGAD